MILSRKILIIAPGYDEESAVGGYYSGGEYDPQAPPSPPTASGGAYYPQEPPQAAGPSGFTQHTNNSQMNVNAYPPPPGHYNPQDYANMPPQPPHYNPQDFTNIPPPPGPPPAGRPVNPYPPTGPENVSRQPPADDIPTSIPHDDPTVRGASAQGA